MREVSKNWMEWIGKAKRTVEGLVINRSKSLTWSSDLQHYIPTPCFLVCFVTSLLLTNYVDILLR